MSFKTSFQWFADYNTSTTGMQIIQFSAGGDIVRKRLAPMFAHYRKYKLGAIHVKFVPAATLPVDPSGLSYEEGENTVDPRDMFNPGLVRHTNGEDIVIPDDSVLNSELMSDSLYYSTMLDKRWHKFRLQRGITLRAFPKFWGVANLRQNMFPGAYVNIPGRASNGSSVLSGTTASMFPFTTGNTGTGNLLGQFINGSSDMSLFQTGQKIPMGWMPTGASLKDEYGLLNRSSSAVVSYTIGNLYMVVPPVGFESLRATFDTEEQANQYLAEITPMFGTASGSVVAVPKTIDSDKLDVGVAYAPVPEIPGLLTLVLPRSRKTQFYYRVYVQEDVYFSDPVTSFNAIELGTTDTYLAPMDVFTRSQIRPLSPLTPFDGVNDGDNSPKNDGDI